LSRACGSVTKQLQA